MQMTRNITKTLKTACLLLAVFVSCPAMADNDTEVKLGYCKENSVTFELVQDRGTGGSALYFPETTMQMYKGNYVTSVRLDVQTATAEDAVRIFITHDLDEEPLYEQRCTISKGGWSTITLDQPFPIDGSALYIGYEVTGQYYLRYSNRLLAGEEYIKTDDKGWRKYTNIYSASFYALVDGDNMPAGNVRVDHVYMPGYAVTGEPLKFSGEFTNLAPNDVDNLTLTYYVDGKAAKEETVDVNRTSYLATGSFEASGLTLEAGRHDVSIELTGVNGKEDSDPTDNTTRTKNVLVIDEFTPRNMLFEVFSTEKCVNCPQAHAVIANTYKDFKDVIELGHHSAYYDDKFTIQASLDYEWFYTNQSMLFAPAGMFDRTCFDDNLPMFYDVKSPVTGLGSSELLVIRQEALSVPAFTTVNIEKSLDKEARKLTLDVSGKALLPIDNPEKVRLYVFLKEDSIYTETQNGASGGFYQRHVARLSMTPTWGDPIDVEHGFAATYSADIPEECNIDNMYAVAFVAYYDPEDHLNCNVLNTSELRLVEKPATGIGITEIDKAEAGMKFDGEHVIVPGGYDRLCIYDMSGCCRLNMADGGTFTAIGHLPKGVYIVKAEKDGAASTLKIKL